MLKSLLITNEKDYIEKISNDGNYLLTEKPMATLKMMAQYYYELHNKDKKEITELLIDFLEKHYLKYQDNPHKWDDICESTAKRITKKADGDKLLITDGIPVTQNEIAKINEIESFPDLSGTDKKTLKRLLFTIVVLGKYQNAKNQSMGYISTKQTPIKTIDLFQLANVQANNSQRNQMIHKLFLGGFIGFPNSKISDNCRALFVDKHDTSKTVIIISDLREIGYQFNREFYNNTFNVCVRCGRLIKTNSKHEEYCLDCFPIRKVKIARCIDCGALFLRLRKTKERCESCQSKADQKSKNAWAKKEKAGKKEV